MSREAYRYFSGLTKIQSLIETITTLQASCHDNVSSLDHTTLSTSTFIEGFVENLAEDERAFFGKPENNIVFREYIWSRVAQNIFSSGKSVNRLKGSNVDQNQASGIERSNINEPNLGVQFETGLGDEEENVPVQLLFDEHCRTESPANISTSTNILPLLNDMKFGDNLIEEMGLGVVPTTRREETNQSVVLLGYGTNNEENVEGNENDNNEGILNIGNILNDNVRRSITFGESTFYVRDTRSVPTEVDTDTILETASAITMATIVSATDSKASINSGLSAPGKMYLEVEGFRFTLENAESDHNLEKACEQFNDIFKCKNNPETGLRTINNRGQLGRVRNYKKKCGGTVVLHKVTRVFQCGCQQEKFARGEIGESEVMNIQLTYSPKDKIEEDDKTKYSFCVKVHPENIEKILSHFDKVDITVDNLIRK